MLVLACFSSVCTICQNLEVRVHLLRQSAENRRSWQIGWCLWRARKPCSDSIRCDKCRLLRYWTGVRLFLLWQISPADAGWEICELFSILRSSAILPEFLILWLVHLWIWLVDFWIWQMHFLIERNNLSRLGFTDDRPLVFQAGGRSLFTYKIVRRNCINCQAWV